MLTPVTVRFIFGLALDHIFAARYCLPTLCCLCLSCYNHNCCKERHCSETHTIPCIAQPVIKTILSVQCKWSEHIFLKNILGVSQPKISTAIITICSVSFSFLSFFLLSTQCPQLSATNTRCF